MIVIVLVSIIVITILLVIVRILCLLIVLVIKKKIFFDKFLATTQPFFSSNESHGINDRDNSFKMQQLVQVCLVRPGQEYCNKGSKL